MPTLYAWLFDAYPSADGMTVWFLDGDGRAHALHDLCRMLRSRGAPVELRRTERTDLFLDRPLEVLEVGVRIPASLPRLLRQAADFRPRLTYYDADIPLPQRYVLARAAFPLAYCAVEHVGDHVRQIEALDSPWELDYRLPPLRVMTMRLSGEPPNPARG